MRLRSTLTVCTTIAALAFAHPATAASLGEGTRLPVSGEYRTPRWSPDGSGLALSGGAFRGLYVTDLSGNARTISDAPMAGWGFNWSPDGRNLAYRMRTDSGTALMVTGNDGKPRMLAPNCDKSFPVKWSKDGLTYKSSDEIVTVGEDGSIKKVISLSKGKGLLARIMNVYGLCMSAQITGATLTALPSLAAQAGKPSGAAGAGEAFVDEESQVWVVDENGDKKKLLDLEGVPGYAGPVQSPTGDKYAVAGFDGNLYMADPNGGAPLNLGQGENPTWSPDGRYVIYTRGNDDGHRLVASDLWMSSADGQQQFQLTNGQGVVEHPAWSPDGHSIAYVIDGVVYVAPIDM